jgi:ketosteroid isomerase-like protein
MRRGRIPPSASHDLEVDLIRATERERLRTLVAADAEAAARLHADDFQLITPSGDALSKVQYLEGVASGEFNYVYWEPDSTIAVRFYGEAAIIRYRSQLEIIVAGQLIPRRSCWHTDCYEKHGGQWRVVWSHATEIAMK